MVLVYTGDGKGKTTASMGLCIRALGDGLRVCIIQFLKSPEFKTGEIEFLKKNGVEVHTMGVGFSWQKSSEQQRQALKAAWELAKVKLADDIDLLVLDEINNIFAVKDFKWDDIMPIEEVISLLNNRDKNKHVCLTGRSAPDELIDAADLVTEMKCIKHYYNSGEKATQGLEF